MKESKTTEAAEERSERALTRELKEEVEELEEFTGWEQAESFLSVASKYPKSDVKEALRSVQPQMPLAYTRVGELLQIFDTAIKTWGVNVFTAVMAKLGYEPEYEVRVDRADYGAVIRYRELVFVEVAGKHQYTMYGTVKGALSPPVQEDWRITMQEDGTAKFFFRSEQNVVSNVWQVKLKAGDKIIKEKRGRTEVEGRVLEVEDVVRILSGQGLSPAPAVPAPMVSTIGTTYIVEPRRLRR